jgi:hypothetical protein
MAEFHMKFEFNMHKIRLMGSEAWKADNVQNEAIHAKLFDLETTNIKKFATVDELVQRRMLMVEMRTEEANFRSLIMENYIQELAD